jgi:hypothetical protein
MVTGCGWAALTNGFKLITNFLVFQIFPQFFFEAGRLLWANWVKFPFLGDCQSHPGLVNLLLADGRGIYNGLIHRRIFILLVIKYL